MGRFRYWAEVFAVILSMVGGVYLVYQICRGMGYALWGMGVLK